MIIILVAVLSVLSVLFILWLLIVPSHKEKMGNLSHVDALLFKEIKWKQFLSAYSKSPFGQTHYQIIGRRNGPKLVFIHGITATASVFSGFIQGLADAGFQVLIYDLFGRGFSDAPATQYNDSLYVSQLYFLCNDLGWESFHLCGLSLGGGKYLAF